MATSDQDQAATGEVGAPALIVVCGLPGVGKSTVAGWIADRVDGVHLRTDEIRKELFPDPEYSAAETETVYETMFDRGRAALARGRSAVLDATFKRRRHRGDAPRVAREMDVPWRLVKVDAEPAVVRERISARTDDVSDADVDIYEQFRAEFEPIQYDHAVVDNSADFATTERRLEERFPRETVAPPQ